jgi:predicted MFS family arabinose efflux permease
MTASGREIGHTVPVTDAPPDRVTYRSVLAVREFRAVFASQGLSVLGDQVARLALALLVYDRSGSALAASATYALSFLAWLVGGPLLSTFADRYERRGVMVVCDLARVPLVLALALAPVPLWVVFALLLPVALLEPPFDSARSALLADILEGEAYLVGNTLMNTMIQLGQVLGFVAGGALVTGLGYRGALLVDAATFAVSALVLVALVRRRPPVRAEAGAGLLADVREGLAVVRRSPRLRWLLAQALLSCGVLIVPEGLAVAVAGDIDGGSVVAGLLTAALPAGVLVGGAALVLVPQEQRRRLFTPFLVLGAAPLLLTPLLRSPVLLVLVWTVAGAGGALQILASSEYIASVPAAVRGRAVGLAGTALMGVQGLMALLGGAAGDLVGPRTAVALAGLLGLLLLLPVAAGAPREAQPPVHDLSQAAAAGRRGHP